MTNSEQAWAAFVADELAAITPILEQQRVALHDEQPHISGERFLMSGKKVVLVGTDTTTGDTVIIKTTKDAVSKNELRHERTTRTALLSIDFAYQPLRTPAELWYEDRDGRLTIITQYIDQPTPFLALPLVQQFDLVLDAFTMLEGVHATTASHQSAVRMFGNKTAIEYQTLINQFTNQLVLDDKASAALYTAAQTELTDNLETIAQFCGFLTHDDFALHNFRFKDKAIYLIDQASLTFGNKHESWARLMNYMVLYNLPLEQAFTTYVQQNRSTEEQQSFRLMRIFKLLELLTYHTQAATTATGAVRTLSNARVTFWSGVLAAIISDTAIAPTLIATYTNTRDGLRSPEEIKRQKVLQQLL